MRICFLFVAIMTVSTQGTQYVTVPPPKQFWGDLKNILVNAVNNLMGKMSDPTAYDEYPENYKNSTVQTVKTPNGTEVINKTIVRSSQKGVQETEITETETLGSHVQKVARVIALTKKRERHLSNGGNGSGVKGKGAREQKDRETPVEKLMRLNASAPHGDEADTSRDGEEDMIHHN